MLSPEERQRYARHLSLPGFGEAAQERLTRGRVLVVGAGGLGSPALLYLAAAGVGHIVVIDGDTVDASNLQRQILYREADLGRPKAEVAAERLRELNHLVTVVPLAERFCRANALELVRGCDVVIDGSDNFATRYLVNDACVMADRPFVYGAIQGFEGQLAVFNWRGGPTYRCLFPLPTPPELAPNCAEVGVLGVLPGIVGTWQATEAIKLLSGCGEPLSGKLLIWNALEMTVHTLALAPDPRSRPIVELPDDGEPVCGASRELESHELEAKLRDPALQLIDVREAWERAVEVIEPSLHIPLGQLEQLGAYDLLHGLSRDQPTVVYCAHGIRSLRAVELLREEGFRDVRSLRGGMAAWRARLGLAAP
jgi:sulfur-carrier protein adenylyltransferase/sulfurtransferase